MSVKQIAL